jgi:HAD superfamily hydrolase (TIGR01450 family)
MLRLAVVTDIHHGPTRYTKKGAAALPLLENFRKHVSQGEFDLVADLGDRISNVDHDTDLALTRDVSDIFSEFDVPRQHLLGNHDLHYISKAENEAIFGHTLNSQSLDIKGWHLVFWQHDLSGKFTQSAIPSQDNLDWLRSDLGSTSLPSIIFTHVPLNDAAMTGNFYFENNAAEATLRKTAEARRVIEAAGNVVLCMAGHVHWNKSDTIDGIRYLTLQSLCESFTTQGEASGAWAEIEIDALVRWQAHGGDPMRFEAPLRSSNMHWMQPMPPYHILRQKEKVQGTDKPVRGVILDMDGVLFRGDIPIDGSAAAVRDLQSNGIDVVCVTNNARRSPEDYARKLSGFGIDLDPSNIFTSGMAVAHYLTAQIRSPEVYIVGSDALRDTLLAAGAIESDDPKFVVAGIDLNLKISDLTPAVRHLSNGAALIASNPDAVIPTSDGPEPEAGPIAAFLESASGQKAIMLGKPQTEIFDIALNRLGLVPEEVFMIGDTTATDIAGAQAAGLRSILVASGNTSSSEDTEYEPTVRFDDLRAAVDYLIEEVAKPN